MSNPTRIHTSLLARVEKRALIWMAERLPPWVSSDRLTLLALLAMAGAGAAFAAARWSPPALFLVIAALAVNWFGDSLDGTLARVRRQERPRYGFYVDHVLDIVGTSFLLIGLSASGLMSATLAFGVLVAYLLVAAEVFLATTVRGEFRMSFFGMGPTELRIVLAVGALRAFINPYVDWGALGTFRLFDVGGVAAIVGLGVALIVSAVRNTRALYLAEPLESTLLESKPM